MKSNPTSVIKKIAITTCMFAMFIGTANATAEAKILNEEVEVTYAGQLNAEPVFLISLDNPLEEELVFTISNNQDVLYSQKIKDGKFSKKFQFQVPELNDLKITVTAGTKTEKKVRQYQISNTLTVSENVQVSRVK